MFRRKLTALSSTKPLVINHHPVYRPKKIFFWSLFIVIVVLVILGFQFISPDWGEFFTSFAGLGERIKELLHWDFNAFKEIPAIGQQKSFLARSFISIWDTIVMALSGTVIGIIIAVPVSILASKNIINNTFFNRFCKILLAIFRTIPSFAYALILVGFFGFNNLTVSIAVAIFTFAISAKMLYDKIEQVKMAPFETMLATGANRFRSFRAAIFPQVIPHILSTVFYALETNLRYISIIGLVAKVGIGNLIDNNAQLQQWDRVGWLLFLLILTIVCLEILIYVLRKWVIFDQDKILDEKERKKMLNPTLRRTRKNNLLFYYNEIILADWKNKKEGLYKQYQQKAITKEQFTVKKEALKLERKTLITQAKKEYFERLAIDQQKFLEIKSAYPATPKKWFIYSEKVGQLVRYDKLYLAEFAVEMTYQKQKLLQETKQAINLKHDQFIANLTVEKVYQKQPFGWIKRVVLIAIMFGLFIYSLTTIEWGLANSETIAKTLQNIARMFDISWWTLFGTENGAGSTVPYSVIYLIWETIMIAAVGTFIGVIIALILGTLGSENVVNKYVAKIFVIIATVIRPIPSYLYAIILISLTGIGEFTGALALAIATAGMLSKYIREMFDDVDMNIVKTLAATGLTNGQKFRYGVLPQVNSGIMSWIIYRFEINIKEATLLGIVGAGNMGYVLQAYFNSGLFEDFGALLFGIIIISLLLEWLSNVVRDKINYNRDPKTVHWLKKVIRRTEAPSYAINAKMLGYTTTDVPFNELKALYILTNINIFRTAWKIKKIEKISWTKAYQLSYCQTFNIKADKTTANLKELIKEHNGQYNDAIKKVKENRHYEIKQIKLKQDSQIKKLKIKFKKDWKNNNKCKERWELWKQFRLDCQLIKATSKHKKLSHI
ncbi:PhnE/PtxC family ABC transporter permease [Spiroplasma chrysopicola]|uniref:Phosphonate transport system permease protein n=1 Tax=Spiroplasma chrysopicola DF-1 TaxID=1276227 RepID=R4UCG8_9MOLU|nr:ABC transporter permease subunit [Spiroplasma chrysopicola]AGM25589.1 phosphonate transport system permease protein [Spiroplasma chrysopicola DF-1]